MTEYKLRIQFGKWEPGTVCLYDPEWNEWTIKKETYNYRGSIGEGEIAMAFSAFVKYKMTSILEPMKEEI